VRPDGISGYGRDVRLLDGGEEPCDYHLYFNDWSKIDTADTVRRDRNHPSIILYSAGNEIHDTPNAGLAKGILQGLVDTFHQNDPTRPVTQALFRPNASHDYTDGLADMLDVVGQNYREREILAAHQQKPTRKIIGTENGMDRTYWLALRDNPPYAGQFLWTGVDYLGESRRWPDGQQADGAAGPDRTPLRRWRSNGRAGGATSRWSASCAGRRRRPRRWWIPAITGIRARRSRCAGGFADWSPASPNKAGEQRGGLQQLRAGGTLPE
jgi:beta-galactosidase